MINLINGDCIEEMDKLIERGIKVDAIICDPPYGTTACKWDSIIPFDEMWLRLNKLIKPNGAIVLFGSEPFSSALRMSNIKHYKYDWVWDKVSGGNPFNNKIMPMKIVENIMVFEQKGKKVLYYPIMEDANPKNIRPQIATKQKSNLLGNFKNGFISKSDPTKRYPKNIIIHNIRNEETNSLNRWHPTQKPVALMEYLVKTYTNENKTVLDFTMGSGSTMVACKKLNRNGIGIELDTEKDKGRNKDQSYFDISVERVNNVDKKDGMLY